MKTLDKKVNIPHYLYELHGKQASIFDLLITYCAAIVFPFIILYLARDMPLSVIKMIALGIISFDVGGGVVANFTQGTNAYYSENLKLRYRFIAMHVIQPLVLIWLFPNALLPIAIISVYTLSSMIFVGNISEHFRQRMVSSFLTFLGLVITFALNISQPIVHIMLIMFIFKLVMAFSVQWK